MIVKEVNVYLGMTLCLLSSAADLLLVGRHLLFAGRRNLVREATLLTMDCTGRDEEKRRLRTWLYRRAWALSSRHVEAADLLLRRQVDRHASPPRTSGPDWNYWKGRE